MKKTLLPLSLLIFGLVSCEKESTIEDDLQGVWYMPQRLNRNTSGRSVNDLADHSLNAWNYSMVVTTNSNQKLIDRMAESEGAISVSGIVNDEIKFMQGWHDRYSGNSSVYITNFMWNQFMGPSDKPIISVNMHDHNDPNYDYVSDYIGIYFNDGRHFDLEDDIEFSFDGKSLKLPNQTFNFNDTASISMEGSLTYATIDIPANTPTKIFSNEGDGSWDYGSWEVHIKEGGRWVEVYSWEDPYDSSGWTHTYTDSTLAEWELEGDTIFVTYRYEDVWIDANGPGIGQGDWLYQVAYTFELQDNYLTLTNEYDMCGDEKFCMEWFEYEYGLDEGSLEEIKMVWLLEFSKTPPPRSKEFREIPRKIIARFPPYSLMK